MRQRTVPIGKLDCTARHCWKTYQQLGSYLQTKSVKALRLNRDTTCQVYSNEVAGEVEVQQSGNRKGRWEVNNALR